MLASRPPPRRGPGRPASAIGRVVGLGSPSNGAGGLLAGALRLGGRPRRPTRPADRSRRSPRHGRPTSNSGANALPSAPVTGLTPAAVRPAAARIEVRVMISTPTMATATSTKPAAQGPSRRGQACPRPRCRARLRPSRGRRSGRRTSAGRRTGRGGQHAATSTRPAPTSGTDQVPPVRRRTRCAGPRTSSTPSTISAGGTSQAAQPTAAPMPWPRARPTGPAMSA